MTVVKCDRCFTMLPCGSIVTRCDKCMAGSCSVCGKPTNLAGICGWGDHAQPQASLHGDATARKAAPMAEGLLWYFPDALAAVSHVSKVGNDQHNPGQPMHHARGKSSDHADCLMRHLALAGTFDKDGVRETAKVAWRALALLQEELERDEGVPLPRNAKAPAAEPCVHWHQKWNAAMSEGHCTDCGKKLLGSNLNPVSQTTGD